MYRAIVPAIATLCVLATPVATASARPAAVFVGGDPIATRAIAAGERPTEAATVTVVVAADGRTATVGLSGAAIDCGGVVEVAVTVEDVPLVRSGAERTFSIEQEPASDALADISGRIVGTHASGDITLNGTFSTSSADDEQNCKESDVSWKARIARPRLPRSPSVRRLRGSATLYGVLPGRHPLRVRTSPGGTAISYAALSVSGTCRGGPGKRFDDDWVTGSAMIRPDGSFTLRKTYEDADGGRHRLDLRGRATRLGLTGTVQSTYVLGTGERRRQCSTGLQHFTATL